jgi:hypothetical protein
MVRKGKRKIKKSSWQQHINLRPRVLRIIKLKQNLLKGEKKGRVNIKRKIILQTRMLEFGEIVTISLQHGHGTEKTNSTA